MKLGPVVQEEMWFKENIYEPTDGRRTKTDHIQILQSPFPLGFNDNILKDFENASPRLNPSFHKPLECQLDNCYCIS